MGSAVGAWTDPLSRSSYTKFYLFFYPELNKEHKRQMFLFSLITLEQPVILCTVCKTSSSATHRLRTVGQGFTENAIDYANGDNDGTLWFCIEMKSVRVFSCVQGRNLPFRGLSHCCQRESGVMLL